MEHAPTTIPTPPDFAVQWESPEDAHLFWTQDRMHFPNPISPMMGSFFSEVFEFGFNGGLAAYEMPIRSRVRCINNYFYQTIFPIVAPEDMEAQGARMQERLESVLPRLGEYWETELLPEIKEIISYWEQLDLEAVPTEHLGDVLDQSIPRLRRMWHIHFLVAFPMLIAMSSFDDMYRDLFSDEEAFAPYRLLQGFDSKTIDGDRVLWGLSRKALETPSVRTILEERAAADVVGALEATPDASSFLDDLRSYLEEYGQRGLGFGELSDPSWIEDPTPAIKSLKDFITQPDRDIDEELRGQARDREEASTAALERLQGYPEPVVAKFKIFLKAAQDGIVLTEVHNFWIDFKSVYWARQVFLACGRRLAQAGVMDSPDDVFYLTMSELRESLTQLSGDRRGLVAERRSARERARTVQPPPALGSEPPGPPPDDPMGRAIGKFWGPPPQPPSEPGVFRGSAGSPGVVRGPAKVVHALGEAGKVQPGDVLVAETTSAPWTPLFGTVVAVVTDTGGILSHCAVVAREYGIPAVVGTGLATAMIQDGQIVEVDGDDGVVRVVS